MATIDLSLIEPTFARFPPKHHSFRRSSWPKVTANSSCHRGLASVPEVARREARNRGGREFLLAAHARPPRLRAPTRRSRRPLDQTRPKAGLASAASGWRGPELDEPAQSWHPKVGADAQSARWPPSNQTVAQLGGLQSRYLPTERLRSKPATEQTTVASSRDVD